MWFALQLICLCTAAEPPSAAALSQAIGQMSPDPKQTFRVRDLQFYRGDLKIYLTEGVLSFLTPVSGKTVAAVFSTGPVEAGDAEVIVLPQQRNERASLASIIKSPNLDEHFDSALFLFTDETAKELLTAIQQLPVHNLPDVAPQLASSVHTLLQQIAADTRGQLVAGLLDAHRPDQGFFYGFIGGRTLGSFDVLYNPADFEQITIGRSVRLISGDPAFQLWASFRSRRSGPYKPPAPSIADYRIKTDIHPDLTLSADANFKWRASDDSGRVIPLAIADQLKIESAQVDGRPAEVFQPTVGQSDPLKRPSAFFVLANTPLAPDSTHEVEVRYAGSVIRRTAAGSYFVDDRNAWYPFATPTLATFDLTFRCPDNLRLVSTGELVSDTSEGNLRVVHRKTRMPEALAGFNLGDYDVESENHGLYHIECYSNKGSEEVMADIPKQMDALLDYYTNRWMPLPIHNIAVSPIPASLGQGFPGLIYLSDVSYTRPEDRPASLRTAVYDQFFTDLLLPHEVAHQWWGNIVTAAEYRSAWTMEAFANYSALQFLGKNHGQAAVDSILDGYRADLLQDHGGQPTDSYGPLEFGIRLIDSKSASVWHTITYEKGSWVLHMLHQRLGDDGFLKLQLRLLHDFADRPLTNEDFRKVAAEFVPAGQPDKNLSLFFDTWIYGTGIPKLANEGAGRRCFWS